MAIVWIPSLLRDLTGGLSEVNAPGETVRDLINRLEEQYPGIRERLCDGAPGEERIRPNIALVVDGVRCRQGLRQPVGENSEVHFVPAISGGAPTGMPDGTAEVYTWQTSF
jgi:sulfur-carrier protein